MSKKVNIGVMLGMFVFSLVFGTLNVGLVFAADPGSVVINEIAWAGSVDSSSDEYIELYNTTGQTVDLTGWTLDDDNGASSYVLSGSIAAYGYYLIEDSDAAVNPNSADLVANLSLANSGDSLVLYDDLNQVVDTVNGTGGAWFAGSASTFASMERIDPLASGDQAANWADSDGSGSTATASLGSLIVGTPGLLNSASSAPVVNPQVSLSLSSSTPNVGDQLVVDVNVDSVDDLFSYGIELNYDAVVLQFVSAVDSGLLSESGGVSTSFQAGLEDGNEGKLLVAEARTIDPKVGVDVSGTLFMVTFDVVGGEGLQSDLQFDAESFLADTSGELAADYTDNQFTPAVSTVDPVTNLQSIEAAQRYSIQLSWDPSADATSYKVLRQDPHGVWVELDELTATLFVDSDAVSSGGDIVPTHSYSYRVIAVKGGVESVPVDVSGVDMRGLRGDNDRSDRVDGRDLDNLARHFAEDDTDVNFDALVDTTYDGMIDGSDLIDLGANFALTYTP